MRVGQGGTIRMLGYARGVAALAVMIFHFGLIMGPYAKRSGSFHWTFGGHLGVQFFFVLSGFIIFHANFGRAEPVSTYISKRVLRIYPMYLLIVAPLGMLYVLKVHPDGGRHLTAGLVAWDLLLLPREGRLILPPAWTLQHELVFYLVFAAFLVSRWCGAALFALWQGACWITMLFTLIPPSFQNLQPAAVFVGQDNLGFAFGAAVALLHRRYGLTGRSSARIVGALGAAALGLVLVSEGRNGRTAFPDPVVESFVALIASACITAGLLSIENVRRPKLDASLGEIGAASYGLYLVHEPEGALLVGGAGHFTSFWCAGPYLFYALLCVSTLITAILLHRLLEEPMLRILHRFASNFTGGFRHN